MKNKIDFGVDLISKIFKESLLKETSFEMPVSKNILRYDDDIVVFPSPLIHLMINGFTIEESLNLFCSKYFAISETTLQLLFDRNDFLFSLLFILLK